jgi:calcineurin-like phosphoesterase family protein
MKMHVHHKIKPEHMNFKGILIEIATIIFAVLLALGAESWWEHHKTLEMVDVSMERINKEIAANLFECVQAETSLTKKMNKLLSMENEIKNNVPFSKMTDTFGGYETIVTNNSTWKRVLNDKNATYFPVDYMESAFSIYNKQDLLSSVNGSLLQFIFGDLFLNKDKEKEAFEISKIYYGQLLRYCTKAIESHSEFLKKYDKENYKQIMAKCDSIKNTAK